MKYALIGCGRIAPNHVEAAINNSLKVVGLCDIDLNQIKLLKEKSPGVKNVPEYSDYKHMIKEIKPDIVAIATESGNHAKIAKEVIKMGCNLIIEKPIALSLKEIDELIFLSKKHDVKVASCHQNRFNKSIQKIREAVELNKFGKVFYSTAHIRWNRNEDYYKQSSWRGTWAQDGGVLMNQGIHNIDLLIWMMNSEIKEVFAYTDNLNHSSIEAEDLGLAIIKFKNGSYGIIEGTTNVYPKNLEETLYIFGEKGTVKAGGSSVNKIEVWKFSEMDDDESKVIQDYSEEHKNVYGFGHSPLYENFVKSIKANKKPYIDLYDGRKAVEIILAIYKSSKTGKPVKLPLKSGSTLDFRQDF